MRVGVVGQGTASTFLEASKVPDQPLQIAFSPSKGICFMCGKYKIISHLFHLKLRVIELFLFSTFLVSNGKSFGSRASKIGSNQL